MATIAQPTIAGLQSQGVAGLDFLPDIRLRRAGPAGASIGTSGKVIVQKKPDHCWSGSAIPENRT
jgi:hypothetical protein